MLQSPGDNWKGLKGLGGGDDGTTCGFSLGESSSKGLLLLLFGFLGDSSSSSRNGFVKVLLLLLPAARMSIEDATVKLLTDDDF